MTLCFILSKNGHCGTKKRKVEKKERKSAQKQQLASSTAQMPMELAKAKEMENANQAAKNQHCCGTENNRQSSAGPS